MIKDTKSDKVGSVPGPRLFIIYANNLPKAIKYLKCILFVDGFVDDNRELD